MEYLKSWAMTVCGVIVFGSVCEMLLPNGSLKKYVRLALGLVMIMTILMPVQRLLSDDVDVPAFSFQEAGQTEAYLTKEQMEEKQQQQVIRIYQENLSSQISAALEKTYGDGISVRAEVESESENRFGELNRVLIMVDAAENTDDITDGIVTIVADTFGVPDDRIEVQYLRQTTEKVDE